MIKEIYPGLNPRQYRQRIETSLSVLKNGNENRWYEISEIEKWLNGNSDFYGKVYDFFYKKLWWYELEDGTRCRLPDELTNVESLFCNLYEKLEELIKFYQYEPEAARQVKLYETARKEEKELRKWVEHNKEFYLDLLEKFFDYNEICLQKGIVLQPGSSWKIAVHPKWFKNCLNLAIILEHYNELQFFEWSWDTDGNYLFESS